MSEATRTIAARSVPVALCEAADVRRQQLNGMTMSKYIEHLIAADCARSGLWMPAPEPVHSTNTPTSGSSENTE